MKFPHVASVDMILSNKRKISKFACDITVLWNFKQLRANALETRLGVTGALYTDSNARALFMTPSNRTADFKLCRFTETPEDSF